ncbi:MAG: hypothetical protein IKE16_06140 [Solobacterium sp.]|nr:hypothetical protein [Solobacterium sp.]
MIDKSLTGHYTDASSGPRHYEYAVAVRFHNSGRAYTFGTDRDDFKLGDRVVVETSQGMELGICQNASMHTRYLGKTKQPEKPVLRLADEEDLRNFEENIEYAKDALAICEEEVKDLALEMHLLSSEYMLDRSKILFVYQAEHRVDFRELLKRLGARLHCRIELRQIGERDKAKMVGGIGLCGMECCCARFKTKTDVISINMAKNQLLALNTEKLSGMCGKLMCCLKYEDANYKELTAGLPKMGAHVEYEGEMYRVTSMNVMTNEARLENSERYQVITIDELREKTIVRKGVAIARKAAGRAQRQTHVAPGVREMHDQRAAFSASESEKSRGISAESKDTSHQQNASLKPMRNERKPKQNRTGTSSENRNSSARNNNNKRSANNGGNNRRRENRRASDASNPNVTVRSFKSSKTKAGEAAKEAKK